jgi:hypothetical protein
MHSAAASSHKPTHKFTQLRLVNINHWLVVDGAFRELLDDGRAAGLFTIKFNCSSQLFLKLKSCSFITSQLVQWDHKSRLFIKFGRGSKHIPDWSKSQLKLIWASSWALIKITWCLRNGNKSNCVEMMNFASLNSTPPGAWFGWLES